MHTPSDQQAVRDLGDGLVMRRATIEDRERLADFQADTLGPRETLHGFVLDLMSGRHPSFRSEDFVLVEDTSTGKIVSSMCLISQTWTYEGISFPMGQPDIVSTDPAYRKRGLVRAQMDEIHRWSAERGELVQGITGIPWYYRQFGYEMALSLDAARQAFRQNVPRLKSGEQEPYRFREATTEDIPFIRAMYEQATARSVIACVRDEALWRYDLEGRSETSGIRAEFRVAETQGGEPGGLLVHSRNLWGTTLGVRLFEVVPGVPYLAVTPPVMRYLDVTGEECARRAGAVSVFEVISFNLGENHPTYDSFPDRLRMAHRPYAWYIRVPDLPAFVQRIASALEKRLAGSPQAGYTGEMKVSFFRNGLRFSFQEGRISVERWNPEHVEDGDAAFPDLTFLQLLFGYRSLDDLQYAFADCSTANDEARALLSVLFPKKGSNVWVGG